MSSPAPPTRVSINEPVFVPPSRVLFAPFPVMMLLRPLPVPSIAAPSVRVSFSILPPLVPAPSVSTRLKVTELCTVSVPLPVVSSSVMMSVVESTM